MSYLILTPNANGHDGISRLTRGVASALRTLSDDVEVWSLSEASGRVTDADVPLRGASGSRARAVSWSLAQLSRECRSKTVVVTHAHLAPLSLPLRWRGARVFQLLLGIEVWKRLSAFQAAAFRSSDGLLCISEHTRSRFDHVNPGFDRTTVCHLGLRDGARGDALGDDGFALVVGRMAACERYKGHDAILDVWSDVVRAAPDARLVVAGDGDDRERLTAKARALGLGDAIRFTGAVSDDELEELYRRCAFFVMPSTNEGFGLVFLEAMRASKACIGALGAASEIIAHGETGFVLDPADRTELTARLVELFTHVDRRASMGACGRERYEAQFTAERFRDRFQAALEAR